VDKMATDFQAPIVQRSQEGLLKTGAAIYELSNVKSSCLRSVALERYFEIGLASSSGY